MLIACTLSARPDAPARARELVRDLPLEPEVSARLELIVSELVANAVVHGGASANPVKVRLRADGREVCGEVYDGGRGFDWEPRIPEVTDQNGRGLVLVDQLTTHWGMVQDPDACVWFVCDAAEVPSRSGRAEAPAPLRLLGL